MDNQIDLNDWLFNGKTAYDVIFNPSKQDEESMKDILVQFETDYGDAAEMYDVDEDVIDAVVDKITANDLVIEGLPVGEIENLAIEHILTVRKCVHNINREQLIKAFAAYAYACYTHSDFDDAFHYMQNLFDEGIDDFTPIMMPDNKIDPNTIIKIVADYVKAVYKEFGRRCPIKYTVYNDIWQFTGNSGPNIDN